MTYIYAVSDIHACLKPFEEMLKVIDLKEEENQLILCGDYIDYGNQSCEVAYRIKELTDSYPNQVVALLGNHEDMFLRFLKSSKIDVWNIEWLGADKQLSTVLSFISQTAKKQVYKMLKELSYPKMYFEIAKIVKEDILKRHSELITWIVNLPLYFENEMQIFVHAGIDEEAEDYWRHTTTRSCYLNKYPATFGTFHIDIIAGHISANSLSEVNRSSEIFWDDKNHFYIDGDTIKSSRVPVLKYDTATRKYSSYRKIKESGELEEYYIT